MLVGLTRLLMAVLAVSLLAPGALAQTYNQFAQGREVRDVSAVLEFGDRITPENETVSSISR